MFGVQTVDIAGWSFCIIFFYQFLPIYIYILVVDFGFLETDVTHPITKSLLNHLTHQSMGLSQRNIRVGIPSAWYLPHPSPAMNRMARTPFAKAIPCRTRKKNLNNDNHKCKHYERFGANCSMYHTKSSCKVLPPPWRFVWRCLKCSVGVTNFRWMRV